MLKFLVKRLLHFRNNKKIYSSHTPSNDVNIRVRYVEEYVTNTSEYIYPGKVIWNLRGSSTAKMLEQLEDGVDLPKFALKCWILIKKQCGVFIDYICKPRL